MNDENFDQELLEDNFTSGQVLNAVEGIRIIPLGGLNEIGMNCLVLETSSDLIVIDCGLMFSDLDHFGVQYVIPDFSYILERKEKLRAWVLTHGHEDHIGALPFALKLGLFAPVYASSFTALLLREKLKEAGLESKTDVQTFTPGESFSVGEIQVQTVSVNHSIVDAAALLIKIWNQGQYLGQIVHTGDFRIDPTPFYGHPLNSSFFKKAGEEGVLLLLSDSTNVERHECSLSESNILKRFEQIFQTAQGLVVVGMFASNIARMGQVFEIAAQLGKKVLLAGRGMERNAGLAREIGYLQKASEVLISSEEFHKYPREKVIVISTGSQAEMGSVLSRIAKGEHKQIELQEGDLVLMSSRYIPGNEKLIGRMINELFKQGARVMYEAMHEIHTSGHATRPELKQMIEWVQPKYFIPIHGEYRHLVHHSDLALECGMSKENVMVAINGDVVELSENTFEKIDHMIEPRVLVDGREGNELSRLVLKERRHLGEKGIVFLMMVRNRESMRILAGPEILSKGLVHENLEGWMLEEALKVAEKVVRDYEVQIRAGQYSMDLQETIRIEVRRFFNNNIGKKPTVVPMVVDL